MNRFVISKITAQSNADATNKVSVGMHIVAINGSTLTVDVQKTDVATMIKASEGACVLELRAPPPPAAAASHLTQRRPAPDHVR
jgi:hypothetical protein